MNTFEKIIAINEKIANYAFKQLPTGTEYFVAAYLKRVRSGLYNVDTLRYANFFINKI